MSKHTPGPWVVFEYNGQPVGERPGIDAKQVGKSIVIYSPCDDDYGTGVGGRTRDERVANALLIAASPDLADVAHMVLTTATVYTPPELVQAATDALRKAGEIPGEVGG